MCPSWLELPQGGQLWAEKQPWSGFSAGGSTQNCAGSFPPESHCKCNLPIWGYRLASTLNIHGALAQDCCLWSQALTIELQEAGEVASSLPVVDSAEQNKPTSASAEEGLEAPYV